MKPKDFYEELFDLSFMTQEEQETIFKATALFAKGACKEQREICANTGKHQKFGLYQYKKDQMINAEEPDCIK